MSEPIEETVLTTQSGQGRRRFLLEQVCWIGVASLLTMSIVGAWITSKDWASNSRAELIPASVGAILFCVWIVYRVITSLSKHRGSWKIDSEKITYVAVDGRTTIIKWESIKWLYLGYEIVRVRDGGNCEIKIPWRILGKDGADAHRAICNYSVRSNMRTRTKSRGVGGLLTTLIVALILVLGTAGAMSCGGSISCLWVMSTFVVGCCVVVALIGRMCGIHRDGEWWWRESDGNLQVPHS